MYNTGSGYYLPPVRSYKSSQVQMVEDRDASEGIAMSIQESAYRREDTLKKYNKFVTESKTYLLEEAMFRLFKKCLPVGTNESFVDYGKTLVSNFIANEGVDSLLRSFEGKSLYLAELSSAVNFRHKCILESCDIADPNTFIIKGSDMTKFYNALDGMSDDKISGMVSSKVACAEKEFIEDNVKDRAKMEELAQETKDKVDQYKNKNSDVTEAVREGYNFQYKQNIQKIRRRPKGILECIVGMSGKTAVTNDQLRPMFMLESGKLDSDKIINVSEVMYTFLEMVNTAKMKDITAEYLKEVIKNI